MNRYEGRRLPIRITSVNATYQVFTLEAGNIHEFISVCEDVRKKKLPGIHCACVGDIRYATPYITPHWRLLCLVDSERDAAAGSFHASRQSSLYLIMS